MRDTRRLREERARLAQEMRELSDAGLKTSDQKEKFDRLDKEQRELKTQIDRIESVDETYRETRLRGGAPPEGQPGGEVGPTEKADQEYRRSFRRYLTNGLSELPMEDRAVLRMERRDMGTGGQGAYPGITSGGGVFVPVGFVEKVEMALKYYGPMLNGDGTGGDGYPLVLPTETGQPLPYPTSNDVSMVGEMIAENSIVTVTGADVVVGMVMLGAFKFSSKLVKVSIELLQDSAFDMESFLIQQFAIRLGRILNTKFTTGAGGGTEPQGIVTAATLGATAVGSNSNDGTGGLNTVGSDDMIELEHAVDPLYRRNARYMFHDSTLKKLKQLKDKYGRPLWLPGLAVREPDTINGYPYLINNDMDQLQAGLSSPPVARKTVLFGAMEKFAIRRVKEMTVLRLSERFAEYGQVAFLGFARYDSQMLDAGTHPIKYLQNLA